MRTRRRSATLTTVLATLALVGASMVGCSADGADSSDGAGSGEEGFQDSSFATAEEYQLAFAACMRDQGIDMPDPGEDGAQVGAGSGDGFMQAAEVCLDELGTAPGGGGAAQPGEGQREFDLAMAQCLRDNGLEVPDPGPNEGLTVPMDAGQELLNDCAAQAEDAVAAGS